MRKTDLELWVRRIASQVLAGQPNEDFRVELKATWPTEISRIARRLAGLANAAHGELVLLIIGLDGKGQQVTGASDTDLAKWWRQVEAQFNELAPRLLLDLNVPVEEKILTALLFETDRAPYIVSTGQPGAVIREVPMRVGTEIRSATRGDLVSILVPQAHLPELTLLTADLSMIDPTPYTVQNGQPPDKYKWELTASLYAIPVTDNRLTIPKHQSYALVRVPGIAEDISLILTELKAPLVPSYSFGYTPLGNGPIKQSRDFDSPYVTNTSSELFLGAAGRISLVAHGFTEILPFLAEISEVSVIIGLKPVYANTSAIATGTLALVPKPQSLAQWRLPTS